MKSNLVAVLAAGVVLLMVSGPLFAHHSASLYDREHPVTVTGTVTGVLFTNPHVQIHFEVKDESGNVEKWVASTSGPLKLSRSGWTAKTLKAGDKITATGAPYRDGRKEMSLGKVVAPNGKVLSSQGVE